MNSEKEKPNYYSILPANVRYDKSLRDKAKLLYSEITALSNKDGHCYANNSYFAKLYDVSLTTISTLISELVNQGYIERVIIYKEGSKEILNRYLKIFKEPSLDFFKEGIKKKLKDNNININNTSINNKEEYNINSSSISLKNNENVNTEAGHIRLVDEWSKSRLKERTYSQCAQTTKESRLFIEKVCMDFNLTQHQVYLLIDEFVSFNEALGNLASEQQFRRHFFQWITVKGLNMLDKIQQKKDKFSRFDVEDLEFELNARKNNFHCSDFFQKFSDQEILNAIEYKKNNKF